MELLVLPDPHERLADEGASLLRHEQFGDPTGHRLLPVGDGNDLLSLQGEQLQATALQLGTALELEAPPLQQGLDVVEQRPLELRHRQLGRLAGITRSGTTARCALHLANCTGGSLRRSPVGPDRSGDPLLVRIAPAIPCCPDRSGDPMS